MKIYDMLPTKPLLVKSTDIPLMPLMDDRIEVFKDYPPETICDVLVWFPQFNSPIVAQYRPLGEIYRIGRGDILFNHNEIKYWAPFPRERLYFEMDIKCIPRIEYDSDDDKFYCHGFDNYITETLCRRD